MQEIKWLFFDLGSTLVDEQYVYERIFQDIANQTGIGIDDINRQAMEFWQHNKIGDVELCKKYNLPKRKWYSEYERLYRGIPLLLQNLKQKYKLGIIANQLEGAKERLANWKILQYFDLIVSSAEVGIAKPNTEIFKLALQQAECAACNAVMIGDRLDNDIIPAKNIGMKTVWVRQGYCGLWNIVDLTARPTYQIDNISFLVSIFL